MFIPGSHKKGVVQAKHDLTSISYPLWTVANALLSQLVALAGYGAALQLAADKTMRWPLRS